MRKRRILPLSFAGPVQTSPAPFQISTQRAELVGMVPPWTSQRSRHIRGKRRSVVRRGRAERAYPADASTQVYHVSSRACVYVLPGTAARARLLACRDAYASPYLPEDEQDAVVFKAEPMASTPLNRWFVGAAGASGPGEQNPGHSNQSMAK